MFYPAGHRECARAVEDLFAAADVVEAKPWIGALVPHAGWVCSGQIAATAIAAMKAARPAPDLVVVFGAVHTMAGTDYGAFDDHDAWHTPIGEVTLAKDVQKRMLASAKYLREDARMHRREHSIEVNLPLSKHAWPDVPFLPIEVPPIPLAPQIGQEAARLLKTLAPGAVYLASSDLTHYGPDYGIAHAGTGERALKWADQNDRGLLAEISEMRADAALAHTQRNHSACGGGAIAALLAAAQELGAAHADVLTHTNSYEVLRRVLGRQSADNFVGYAAVGVG